MNIPKYFKIFSLFVDLLGGQCPVRPFRQGTGQQISAPLPTTTPQLPPQAARENRYTRTFRSFLQAQPFLHNSSHSSLLNYPAECNLPCLSFRLVVCGLSTFSWPYPYLSTTVNPCLFAFSLKRKQAPICRTTKQPFC